MNKTEMTESRIFYTFRLAGKPLRGLVILILLAGMVLPYQFSAQAVAAPVAQYPNDVVGSTTPTFRWTEVSGSTGYTLYIYTLENVKIFSSPVTFTCEEGVCRYSHTAALTQGAYKWAVKATNGSQFSPTSNWLTFSVAPPAAPTALSPSGTISNPNPIFAWTKVAGATGYRLYVYTSANAKVFSGVVTPTCGASICEYASSLGLTNGDYRFAVKARNSDGFSPTSNWRTFSIAPPPAPTAISPHGTIGIVDPTFVWTKVADAVGYSLYVYTSTNVSVFAGMLSFTCDAQYCQHVSSLGLTNGGYKFAVRARNACGYSPTSNWVTFTVSLPPPPAPTAISPTGLIYNASPAFAWTNVSEASAYTLYVYTMANVNVFAGTVAPICGDFTCTFASSLGLADGEYKFAVKARNVNGFSPTSNWVGFNLATQGAISVGNRHACALTSAGAARCWGDNLYGQLGSGNTPSYSNVPVAVSSLTSGVTEISTGAYHTCSRLSGGAAKCWGMNNFGQVGNSTNTNSNVPVDVSGLTSGVNGLKTENRHTCAVTSSGGVKCWGYNNAGQLGDGSTINRNAPVDVSGLSGAVKAATTGFQYSCALTSTGAVKCWGNNDQGQLGDGTNNASTTPVDVSGLSSGVIAVQAGYNTTCAITSAGGVKCWGSNLYGQLGNGTSGGSSNVPLDVSGLTSAVRSVDLGNTHTCAVTSSGGVKCWGKNMRGQLGNGTDVNSNVPVDVSGLTSGVAAVNANNYSTCAVLSAGGVKCWGENEYGQLGNGSFANSNVPVDVVGSSEW